ncbi:MAG: ComEC/Rec2 family competence protein [Alphaproteobacteria bacterium]|nr:ComEC/Rec2 family competence protein [Alphaproteobacteria bacterium]
MNPLPFLQRSFFDDRARWFLWVPVFLLAGISTYFALSFEPPLGLALLTPALACMLFLGRRRLGMVLALAPLLAFATGFHAAQFQTWRVQRPVLAYPLETASVTGILMRVEPLQEGSRLLLKDPLIYGNVLPSKPVYVRMRVRQALEDVPLVGSRINLWGPLWPPAESAVPSGFDFRRQAYFEKLGASGMSYVPPRLRDERKAVSFFFDGIRIGFERARWFLMVTARAQLDGPAQTLTVATLTGQRSSMDPDTVQAMRMAGIVHLLAISGLHVGMMALLIYVPLRFFLALFPFVALRFPIKKIAALAAIILTAFYAVLVGASPPTMRAALMIGLVFFAIVLDRKAISLRVLAMAACALMLLDPFMATGVSFQLSFAAVLALTAFYEKKNKQPAAPKNRLASLGRHGGGLVVTSLLATAATLPFSLYVFQVFHFYGVFTNILAIPLTTLWIMPCLLLTYLTAPLGMSSLFLQGAGLGADALIAMATHVSHWPLAEITTPRPPLWSFLLMVGGGLWLCLWKARWRFFGLVPMVLAMSYLPITPYPNVFVAADAPLWAVKLNDGRLAVYGRRKENVTIAQWRQRAGYVPAFYLSKQESFESASGDLVCDDFVCRYTKDGLRISFVKEARKPTKKHPLDPKARAAALEPKNLCAQTDMVIGFEELPSCEGVLVIDGQKQRAHGALMITRHGGQTILKTSRTGRGQRPWSQPDLPPRDDWDAAEIMF